MAEVVKTRDLNGELAGMLFELLNYGDVKYSRIGTEKLIITDIEPNKLRYPEGWYYGKGCFRNKHESTTGVYDEVRMVKSTGEEWGDIATYCTRRAS